MSANLFQQIRRPIWGKAQKVAYTGTAGSTTALPPGTNSVTLYCSTAAFVRVSFGASATAATTGDYPVPANIPVTLPCDIESGPPSTEGAFFASAVQDAAGGNIFVIPNAD